MIKHKTYILTLLTFLIPLATIAQDKLGRIKDPDGFTNVRSGAGVNYEVVDTLFENEFFYFSFEDDLEWANIIAWKGRQVKGYMHKSRIQEINELSRSERKELIIKTLDKHKELANNFQKAYKSKDSASYFQTRKELELHSDTNYDPILTILPNYFCSTNDLVVISSLLETIWADKGSANELPAFVLGECFVCNPKIILNQLSQVDNSSKKEHLIDFIEWGLMNKFSISEDDKTQNKEYNNLMDKLNKAR